MILKLVKLGLLAFSALVCLSALVIFVKKARRQTKSQTKAQLKKVRLLQGKALAAALLLSVVYATAVYFDSENQATAVISLNYAEASQGKNANGTRYNMSEIIGEEVLQRTIEKGGFEDITVDDLKSCLSVSPLIQGNAYNKNGYHISTEFVVYYTAGRKTRKYASDTLVQLLCNAYRDYYFDNYVDDFVISPEDFELPDTSLDFLDTTTLLSKKANKILNYLYGLQKKNSSFVSSQGATFASVASKVSNINDTQINETLFSYVLQNGLSHNSSRLLSRLNYANVQSNFEKQKVEQSYTTTNQAVARYDKDMTRVVLVPTWDNAGQYYMGRTKVGIDTLSVQSVEYSQKMAEIEKSIQDNNLKLARFGVSQNNTAAHQAEAQKLITSLQTSLKKMAEEARNIGREYYSNQMNQCISATVRQNSVFSRLGQILLIGLLVYVAFWARKTARDLPADKEVTH